MGGVLAMSHYPAMRPCKSAIVVGGGVIGVSTAYALARDGWAVTVLDRCDGVQTQAAELLKMSFRSFRYYAKKLGLTGGASEDDPPTAPTVPLSSR